MYTTQVVMMFGRNHVLVYLVGGFPFPSVSQYVVMFITWYVAYPTNKPRISAATDHIVR